MAVEVDNRVGVACPGPGKGVLSKLLECVQGVGLGEMVFLHQVRQNLEMYTVLPATHAVVGRSLKMQEPIRARLLLLLLVLPLPLPRVIAVVGEEVHIEFGEVFAGEEAVGAVEQLCGLLIG